MASPAHDPPAPHDLLLSLFHAAVDAADPFRAVKTRLAAHALRRPAGRTIVVGGGKAAASMAAAVDEGWSGPLSGLVIAPHGQGGRAGRIEIAEGAHPIPDATGVASAARLRDQLNGVTADDLVIALISGGGSALLTLPPDEVPLGDVQALFDALLKAGAPIGAMNTVRKHLGLLHGGRLARLSMPARLVTFAISDVPGDDPSIIASGPTVPDRTTADEARRTLDRWGIEPPNSIRRWLNAPKAETPKPGDAAFDGALFEIVASPWTSLCAAAERARAVGLDVVLLGDSIEGEAREVGRCHAGMALSCRRWGHPARPPVVILSGGETTVTVRGDGRGGRNTEFALGCALGLAGALDIWGLAADTDGVDGASGAAGAWFGPALVSAAAEAGLDAAALLAKNDSVGVFRAAEGRSAGGLVRTGPTGTNVNDFRALLILPPGP